MKITLSKEEVFEIINEYTKAKMNITTGVKGDSLDNLFKFLSNINIFDILS